MKDKSLQNSPWVYDIYFLFVFDKLHFNLSFIIKLFITIYRFVQHRAVLGLLHYMLPYQLNERVCVAYPWWHHQMETVSALLALCAENSPVTGEFPHNGQLRGALMISWISAWKKRLSKQARRQWLHTPSCSLWRHVATNCHIDATADIIIVLRGYFETQPLRNRNWNWLSLQRIGLFTGFTWQAYTCTIKGPV